jgi:DNA-binding PadR family transcriptional regulator
MPRLTLQVRLVLGMLLEQGDHEVYGLEIVDATGLPPGTIYPIMARLETAGWVSSRWEETAPHTRSRPRRRYYALTAEGSTAARAAAEVDRAAESRRRARVIGPVGGALGGAAR